MKKEYIRSHIFNFRLFLEGLKRLRVIGLASGILSVTVSMLIPITQWINEAPKGTYSSSAIADQLMTKTVVKTGFACVPAACMVLLAPFFMMVLFSFLRRRKDSDFFHAIPYSRTCVYTSFSLAALTFVAAIQILSALSAGILWAVCPYCTLEVGPYIGYVLVAMLTAAFAAGFMAVALPVSGTTGSCVLLFALFISFFRVVGLIFLSMAETITFLPSDYLWNQTIISPNWSLPLSLFLFLISGGNVDGISIFAPIRLVYHAVVTLALFAFGGVLYKFRRSEMAGSSAPGRRTQALFRIMFTLMLALLLPMLPIIDSRVDDAIVLVLIVAVLLVYFLYEFITTKRAGNMLKVIPGLGIVAAVCVAFFLLFLGYRTVILYEDVEAEDIKSVTINVGYLEENSYQYYLSQDIRVSDDVIKEIVAEQFEFTQEHIDDRDYQYVPLREWSDEKAYGNTTVVSYYETMTIRLKNGRKMTRRLMFTYEQVQAIHERLNFLGIYADIRYCLPEKESVNRIFAGVGEMNFGLYRQRSHEELENMLEIFAREYEALSEQQKQQAQDPSDTYRITLYGEMPLTYSGHPARSYGNTYALDPTLFPETIAYMIKIQHGDLKI